MLFIVLYTNFYDDVVALHSSGIASNVTPRWGSMLKKLVEMDKEDDSVRNGMSYPLPHESHLNHMKGQDLPIPPAYVTRHSKTRRFSHSVDLHKTDLKLPNTE